MDTRGKLIAARAGMLGLAADRGAGQCHPSAGRVGAGGGGLVKRFDRCRAPHHPRGLARVRTR
jgi:hypothetical protein